MSWVTIYSLEVLLPQFGTSPLFHIQLLLDLHTGFSGDRYFNLFKNFPEFAVIHTVNGFDVVNEAEIDIFLEFSCFFNDPMRFGTLISGSSASSKFSLYIWKFLVHILLKPGLENSEHDFLGCEMSAIVL